MSTLTADAESHQLDDVTHLDVEPRQSGDDDKTIRLAAPDTGVKATWRAMGPGIAAAMTGIGASHIMHAPTAGAQFGYALLWIIPFAYFLKYCAFEFAHRYTMVRGESIMNAYERIGEGAGKWPFWYLAFQTLANTFGVAGRAMGCAAMLYAAFPFVPMEAFAIGVLLLTVAILWGGSYAAVEAIVKVAIVMFAAATVIAFVLQAPPPGEYMSNLMPALAPAGAAMLFGSMFGYFPTTVEVSVMQSNWAEDKRSGMVEVNRLKKQGYNVILHGNFMKNSMRLFHRDMNISYILAMVTGMMFLIVGAVMLKPEGIVVSGQEMGATIAKMYTDQFGAWIFPIIVAGGVAALFSTVFTYFDGQARVFEECAVRLRKSWDDASTRKLLYRGFQVLWVIGGIGIMIGMPEPIVVVQIASVLALLFAPVIMWLNIRSLDYFEGEERELLPATWMRIWAWIGVFGLASFSFYVLYMQFIGGG
ncbi:MAG: Nramp family divalent metal transporter [Halofilum sp. (in: g-proteobacteria)]